MNWISVLTQLPAIGQMVLVLMTPSHNGHMQSIRTAYYTLETHYVRQIPTHWYNPNQKEAYANVTHWMPYTHREEMQ